VFAISWGDAPAWLAVAVASAGGWIALRQLRDQQDVIRRQTVQLERQQAEQIGFCWESARQIDETIDDPIWMGVVRNDSRRPIRMSSAGSSRGQGRSSTRRRRKSPGSSMWAWGRVRVRLCSCVPSWTVWFL
jgi:hypothetical protein